MDDFLTEGGKQKPLFQSNRDTKLKKNNIWIQSIILVLNLVIRLISYK
jgi:hypothetical protein